jgi:hypothetical protein
MAIISSPEVGRDPWCEAAAGNIGLAENGRFCNAVSASPEGCVYNVIDGGFSERF